MHFLIAFLVAAVLVQLLSLTRTRHRGLAVARTWLLWSGTTLLWVAVAFGLPVEGRPTCRRRAGLALLLSTAYHGVEFCYLFGMGVVEP